MTRTKKAAQAKKAATKDPVDRKPDHPLGHVSKRVRHTSHQFVKAFVKEKGIEGRIDITRLQQDMIDHLISLLQTLPSGQE